MSSERGQDTVEWAGVLVVVALVVLAIFVTGVPPARGVVRGAQGARRIGLLPGRTCGSAAELGRAVELAQPGHAGDVGNLRVAR